MNLDFHSVQALAGARAFQQGQPAQRGDARPSAYVPDPAELPAMRVPTLVERELAGVGANS